ncbi:aldehyde dehydrogenase [Nocardioides sp.]|uniref:aldehyde dehydrogenase n=1 Tax=Nocardioides sp. TaxID=35761 RepID=UPI003D13BDF1
MPTVDGYFVDGTWTRSTGTSAMPVVNPYTEEVIGESPIATRADVDAAVRSARRALDGEWRETTLGERIALVLRVKELLAARADDLAEVTSRSMGVPYEGYRSLSNSLPLIDAYIEDARQVLWEYLRSDPSGDALIVRRPVGVVAGLVPWNVPVRSEIKKVVPALLSGCTIVLKPAPETPFGAAALADICAEAGVPAGVVNVVTGDGGTGADLVTHPLVRKVAFTGSSATGSRIWAAVAENFTRLQLELGGKSAAVLLDDVDLDKAVPHLAAGIFNFAGQQCTATSRVLVPRARHEEVVERLRAAAQAHVLGDPFDPRTTMGPLVTEQHSQRVLGYVESGKNDGAVLAAGGGRPTDQPHGWFVEPTVFASVTSDMRIAREEIFGPIVAVMPYSNEEEAISIANDSEYGLGGAVHSADTQRALAVARRIDSGFVSINRYGIGPRIPFGGVKRSGIGRESGVEGFDSFLEYASYPLLPEQARELSGSLPSE